MTKPNVLIYTNHLLPASETFIRNTALSLENYAPFFVGARRVCGLPLPDERVMVAYDGNCHVDKLRQFSRVLLSDTIGMERLAEKLRPLQPRLLQAHFGFSGVNAAPLAEALGIPLIVYYHGFDATMTDAFARRQFYGRRYLRLRERLKSQATLFLAQSGFLRDCMVRQGFPEDKIVVHYVGTETKSVLPIPLSAREPVVLFVGRLVEKKGVADLIDAMARVQREVEDARLVLVGDGRLRTQLEQRAHESLRNFQFVGWQTPEEVLCWMQRARIFCGPSITAASGDSEGFGMVFAEAQSVGLPVVSYAHGGIPEAVAHGETGLLAPEGDVDALSCHLAELLRDDSMWTHMSQAGPRRVRSMVDLRQQALKLERLYQTRVLSETAPELQHRMSA